MATEPGLWFDCIVLWKHPEVGVFIGLLVVTRRHRSKQLHERDPLLCLTLKRMDLGAYGNVGIVLVSLMTHVIKSIVQIHA